MKLYTIGFTKTSAQHFFDRLRRAGVRIVVDVRLNNVSQLAGFAKKEDLRFFCRELVGASYAHRPELAPTQTMLDQYKKSNGSWDSYAAQFNSLLVDRQVEEKLVPGELDAACFLCSEDKPHHCHRRLVAEYLRAKWGPLEIAHL